MSLYDDPKYAYWRTLEAKAERDKQLAALAQALESIIIRCRDGDKKTNWLPIIDGIATAALRAAGRTK